MSFATFRACMLMYVLACGVSSVSAMQKGSCVSLAGIIPESETFSKAFIEGHRKIFELMAYETDQQPYHSREWMRCAYAGIAQDIFASIFPPERREPLSFEEEQTIIRATRKRMREHAELASRVVDNIMCCIRREQFNEMNRARGNSDTDTDDF